MVIVLFNVPLDCEVILSPVVFGLSIAIQVKEAATLLVRGILTVPALQIVAVVLLVIAGAGFTVTVTVCAVPTQLHSEDVGVTE